MRATSVLLACLAGIAVAGCGSSPAAPTVPSNPAPVIIPPTSSTYDGVWTGTSEQAQPVSFTIASGKVTNINFNYISTNNPSSSCSGAGGFGAVGTLGTIADDSFLITNPFTNANTLKWTVSARFTTSSSASGTLEVSFSSVNPAGPCNSSVKTGWTASR